MNIKICGILGAMAVLAACNPAVEIEPEQSEASLKLYTMSCGQIDISDLSGFSTGGEFDGKARVFASSCYLIRHANGDLMWDAGLPDALAEQSDGVVNGVFHLSVPRTLASQLEEINIAPDDIEFFAMSHSHFDHTGNANLFRNVPNWIVDAGEHGWMFDAGPAAGITDLSSYDQFKDKAATKITEDYDVFGDGSVIIVRTPGHTPGHLALLVKLPETGNLLLTGDLYHMPESREFRRVPRFNTSPDDTLASMDKFEALAKAQNARVIIQHSKADVASLPAFPAFAE